MSRYCSTPADLALLHTMCRTAHHRLEALKATVLASAACGLGVTSMCEVNRLENKIYRLDLWIFRCKASLRPIL